MGHLWGSGQKQSLLKYGSNKTIPHVVSWPCCERRAPSLKGGLLPPFSEAWDAITVPRHDDREERPMAQEWPEASQPNEITGFPVSCPSAPAPRGSGCSDSTTGERAGGQEVPARLREMEGERAETVSLGKKGGWEYNRLPRVVLPLTCCATWSVLLEHWEAQFSTPIKIGNGIWWLLRLFPASRAYNLVNTRPQNPVGLMCWLEDSLWASRREGGGRLLVGPCKLSTSLSAVQTQRDKHILL